jgi:hypothetical protein
MVAIIRGMRFAYVTVTHRGGGYTNSGCLDAVYLVPVYVLVLHGLQARLPGLVCVHSFLLSLLIISWDFITTPAQQTPTRSRTPKIETVVVVCIYVGGVICSYPTNSSSNDELRQIMLFIAMSLDAEFWTHTFPQYNMPDRVSNPRALRPHSCQIAQ